VSGVIYGFLWVLTRIVSRVCFRYRVEGQIPKSGGLLIAANHASYLDIPLLGCGIRRRAWYLGRNDLFPIPVLNSMLQALGWIPVRLGRLDREAFGKAINLIRAGKVVVIFPEGGRSLDGHLREPKAGIGVIVSQTGCPVVPAYLKGTFDVLPPGASWPQWHQVTVRFGEPIQFEAAKQPERAATKQFYQQVSRTVIERIAALGQVPVPKRRDDRAPETPNRPTADAHNAE
jgi:1-acyl-sn-glycerol-3-phosphate acyltransferase